MEQKIGEFKKLLYKSKRIQKYSLNKRINAKKINKKKKTENLNCIASAKYGHPLEEIEVKSLKDDKFREIYYFYRVVKVKKIQKGLEK